MLVVVTMTTRPSPASFTVPLTVAEAILDVVVDGTPEKVGNYPRGGTADVVGKSVTITFQVTLNSAMPFGTNQVSNQGSVSGSNFATVSSAM